MVKRMLQDFGCKSPNLVFGSNLELKAVLDVMYPNNGNKIKNFLNYVSGKGVTQKITFRKF